MIEKKKTHESKKDKEHKQKKRHGNELPDEVDQMESHTKEARKKSKQEKPSAEEDSTPPKSDKRQKKRKLESSAQEQQHKTKGEKRSKQVENLLVKMDNETQPEQSSSMSPTKRKTKSSKKPKKTKKELPSDGDVDSDKESVDSMCLTYLRTWKQNRDQWAFKKVRQVWLLQNMYSCDRVPYEDFEVLLEYMADLKGSARQLTVEKAEKLLSAEEADDKEGEKLAEAQYERVRQVMQLLT